jgi:hypothetical protein
MNGKGSKPRPIKSYDSFAKNWDDINWRPERANRARCRVCNNNKIPFNEMAIFSYKISYGGFTGVCKKCIGSEDKMNAYWSK